MNKFDNQFYNGFYKFGVCLLILFFGIFLGSNTSDFERTELIYNNKIDSLLKVESNYKQKIDSLESIKDSIKIIVNTNTIKINTTKLKIDTVWKEYRNVEKTEFDSIVNSFITNY